MQKYVYFSHVNLGLSFISKQQNSSTASYHKTILYKQKRKLSKMLKAILSNLQEQDMHFAKFLNYEQHAFFMKYNTIIVEFLFKYLDYKICLLMLVTRRMVVSFEKLLKYF